MGACWRGTGQHLSVMGTSLSHTLNLRSSLKGRSNQQGPSTPHSSISHLTHNSLEISAHEFVSQLICLGLSATHMVHTLAFKFCQLE